jgi:hypothetical protein
MSRLIQFEGLTVQVPDDASDQEVASILQARNAPVMPLTPGGVPIGPNGIPRVVIGDTPPEAPPVDPNADKGLLHNFAVGAQGVGAGLRDIVLAPFDLAAGAQNLITGGINKVSGANIPYATPASQIAEKVVEPFSIPESDMSPKEKLAGNINRFATQALGTGAALAQRVPQMLTQTAPSADFAGRTLDTLARPYTVAPARTAVGDAVAGAGAGAAVNATQELLPKEPATPMGQLLKNVASVLAPIAGGSAASLVQGVGEGVAGLIRNLASRRTDTILPVRPSTGVPFTLADSERAARELQARATGNPNTLARDIRENASDLTGQPVQAPLSSEQGPIANLIERMSNSVTPATVEGETSKAVQRVLDKTPPDAASAALKPGEIPVEPSQMPTSGLLSRDPGLVSAETGDRVRKPGDFVQRDQNVKEAAGQRIQSVRDDDADQTAVATAAQANRDARIGVADAEVDRLTGQNTRMGQMFQDWSAQFAPVANSEAKGNASRNLDRTIVDEGYVPARIEKNRQFDEAPGRGEQLPADDVLAAVDRIRRNINDLGPAAQMPGEFVQRLEALRPQIVDGVNVGGTGTASGADLADLRKYINTARQSAQEAGNFDLADNIGNLGQAINRTIETAPGYAEANANYREFAGRYRPERNDEMAKFTRELDRSGNTDGTPNRGATPPSETAGRFLSSPEKAAALQRVLQDAPNAAAGQQAARDYLRSDFAMTALNPDGTLNPARASAWARNNADVLSQFPAVRAEFDGYVQTAQRGQQLSDQARTALDGARKERKATEAEIDRSAVGTLLKEDPRDVASKILNGGYGAEKQLDEINALVKNDPVAARGWKAAVSEVLTDKVTSSRKVGETPEVQYARLAKEFKDNEALLAKVYTPEELNTLRQGHKLLEYFKESEKRATVGSNTADKEHAIPGWAQLAVRHVYGDLRGGGIIKRFKLLLDLIPTNKASAEEIAHMAWFNPNVAAYLLERPVKNYDVPQYNINLRRLMAASNAARGD